MPATDRASIPESHSSQPSALDLDFSFAFQPIVHGRSFERVGFEALIRGVAGERAQAIIERIQPHNRFEFDQSSRIGAIQLARRVGIDADLHLNCTEVSAKNLAGMLQATGHAARANGFEAGRVVLEFRDLNRLGEPRELAMVRERCEASGFRVAADNVGTGEIGLKRLVVFRPNLVKLDRELVSGIHASRRRQALLAGLIATCRTIGAPVVATGVEDEAEYEWLAEAGIELFQGYYFARPGFEAAPTVARRVPKTAELAV